ncbi:MAG: hypothetical protein LC650_00090 [Actinobacteria bacterium]|nr:hypothetical protein [Actinomycetota bacterium]
MSTVDAPEVPIIEFDFDIESMLENDIRHFRSIHHSCMGKVRVGSIIEANCGQLYRTSGGILGMQDRRERCTDCNLHAGKLPCLVCGKSLGSAGIGS